MTQFANQKKSRNGNVEFFRCCLMFLIVFWHCYDCGPFGRGNDLGAWSIFFALTFWHVDGFVVISGWYGIRFAWSKYIRLLGVFCFASVISAIAGGWGNAQSVGIVKLTQLFKIDGGWFGGSYMFLMFVAPMIECALTSANARSRKFLINIWLLFAVGMVLSWAPVLSKFTGVHPTGGGGWSFLTIVFVYVTARTARMLDLCFSNKLFAVSLLALLGAQFVLGGGAVLLRTLTNQPVYGFVWGAFSTYDAPHMWMFAIALFMMFEQRVKLPQCIQRTSALLAPSMLSVYLLHHSMANGQILYVRPQLWMDSEWGVHPFMNISISAVLCFSVCLVIDLARRICIRPFEKRISNILGQIDAKWTQLLDRI